MKDIIQPSSRDANEARLFAIDASELQEAEPSGRPRLRRAERHQVVMHVASLDSLLPEDHRARLVWEYVQRLDLSRLYEQVGPWRVGLVATRLIRGFPWSCGFTLRWTVSARLGNWAGCVKTTWPTNGFAAGCR